jgi:hypothetical protein
MSSSCAQEKGEAPRQLSLLGKQTRYSLNLITALSATSLRRAADLDRSG